MLIDETFPENIRKVMWYFELFQAASAALTPKEREMLKAMAELEHAHKRLEKVRVQISEETAKGVTV